MTDTGRRSWDKSVWDRTQSFVYQDSTVRLQVENVRYSVSRHKLTTVSPVFDAMFKLPQVDEEPIILHHRAEDFEHFLWFLHADYFDFSDYLKNCPADQRVRRALGIASMAHFYEASTMCTWALQELVTLLPMSNLTDVAVLKRLYVFATDADQRLCQIFKEYWLQLVESSADPVEWLIAAKDIRDEYLQAHAYFHILKKTNAEIRAEPRLSTIDKLRLNIGTTNLRRYQVDGCGCVNPHYYGHICGHTQDPDQWSPKTRAPLQANYGTLSLWDMFTRSPMGFDLTDGVELVMPGAKWGES